MGTNKKNEIQPDGGWNVPQTKRISPMSINDIGFAKRLLLNIIEKKAKVSANNFWLTFMHNFRLTRGLISFASKMMPNGELKRKDTELAILRVAWNCKSRYEWGQHVEIGLQSGLTEEAISRIPLGKDVDGWNEQQMAIISACDELHHENIVSDNTWLILSKYYNERLLLELLMLIGYYSGLAGVLNSVGIPLDHPLEVLLAKRNIHNA